MPDPAPRERIVLPPGWTIDELIVWAFHPERFDVEPRLIPEDAIGAEDNVLELDALPKLTEEDRAALERLGSPEVFIARISAKIEGRTDG